MKVKNISEGPRGFRKSDDTVVMLEPGQVVAVEGLAKGEELNEDWFAAGDHLSTEPAPVEIPDDESFDKTEFMATIREHVAALKEQHGIALDAAEDRAVQAETKLADAENEIAALKEQLAKFDPDGDGKTGGSVPGKLPGLTNKSKADLLAIAEAEGVTDVSEDMTVEDIKTAIELKREESAQA